MALVNNQMALNSVYNYFLTAYAPDTNQTSRYDTHKKSELRKVYSSIVKQSKESPTYILDTSPESQSFAVGMKEGARQFSNTINSLSTDKDSDALNRKVALTTDEDVVSAKYIGDPVDSGSDLSFDITVKHLATTQINEGRYLDADAIVDMPKDTYSFDLLVNDVDYEFQFNVGREDTNRDLQEKLESLINKSNIGITASIAENGYGGSALVLESNATGISPDKDSLFSVTDEHTSKAIGAVMYLGIGDMQRPATNAEFELNGTPKTAFSNTFTIDKQFEVTLNSISENDDPVTIGLKPDIESMTDNISQLVDSYNGFIDKARAYSGTNVKTDTLISDMKRTTYAYQDRLSEMGMDMDDEGHILIDSDKLIESLESDKYDTYRDTIQDFTKSLKRKSGQISLNPMNYVQKVMVAYKNPSKSYPNPYVTSIYSGMMFNGYC